MDIYSSRHQGNILLEVTGCNQCSEVGSAIVATIAERLHIVARGGGYKHLKLDSGMYDVVTPRIY
jgi:hypothetical protein